MENIEVDSLAPMGKRGRGRPAMPARMRLQHRLEFGLDYSEWMELKAHSDAANRTPGLQAREWIREKLKSLRPPAPPAP